MASRDLHDVHHHYYGLDCLLCDLHGHHENHHVHLGRVTLFYLSSHEPRADFVGFLLYTYKMHYQNI
jgi:hypothetical protein